jgi:hypothetical protein
VDVGVQRRPQGARADVGYLLGQQRRAQLARHFVQQPGVRLALAGARRAVPLARHQLAGHQADDQHHGKGDQVFHIRDGKRQMRLDKEKIKQGHRQHRRQRRRATAVAQRGPQHAQQVEHHQIGGVQHAAQRQRQHGDGGA